MGTHRTGLWTAALIACGMLLAEDPAVIAVRQHLRAHEPGGTGALAIDAALAAAMLAYNVAAIRYVAGVSSAHVIERAIAELAAERTPHGRLDAMARAINPFHLIKALAERAGAAIERAGLAARRRGRAGVATLLGDIAVVNLLGVPGAGIQRSTSGRRIGRRESFRLSALFVASWFVGAWAIELVLDVVDGWPVVGDAVGAMWGGISTGYSAVTDVTSPLGAICVTLFVAAVLRTVLRVDRRARVLLGGGAAS